MARLLYFIFVQLKRWWCDWNWLITICFDNDTYYTELFQGFENEKEVAWHSSIVLNYTYLVFIYIRSNLLWKKGKGEGISKQCEQAPPTSLATWLWNDFEYERSTPLILTDLCCRWNVTAGNSEFVRWYYK